MAKKQPGGRSGRSGARAGRAATSTKPAPSGAGRSPRSPRRQVPVKPLAFGILAVTVGGGLGWFAVWAPRAAEVAELQGTRTQLEVQLVQLKDRVRSATEAQADIATVEAEYGRLMAAIPEPADVDGLVAAGTEAAAAAGVTLLSTTPLTGSTAPTAGTPLSVVGLDLAVRGTPEGVTAFVDRLEGLARLVVVDRLALGGDGSGQVTATVSVRAFHTGSLAGPALTGTTGAAGSPGQPVAPGQGDAAVPPGAAAPGDPAAAPVPTAPVTAPAAMVPPVGDPATPVAPVAPAQP